MECHIFFPTGVKVNERESYSVLGYTDDCDIKQGQLWYKAGGCR